MTTGTDQRTKIRDVKINPHLVRVNKGEINEVENCSLAGFSDCEESPSQVKTPLMGNCDFEKLLEYDYGMVPEKNEEYSPSINTKDLDEKISEGPFMTAITIYNKKSMAS
jgi:hypothetical protein